MGHFLKKSAYGRNVTSEEQFDIFRKIEKVEFEVDACRCPGIPWRNRVLAGYHKLLII